MDTPGKRIKFLREKLDLSQEDLSKTLNLDRVVISNIEHDKRPLKVDDLIKLSQALNVSIDQLLGIEDLPVITLEPEKLKVKKETSTLRISVPSKNIQKFKETLLYILREVGAKPNIGETVLYKLLYFIDFNYYEKFEEQLIGATYIKNHYGPTPIEFQEIVKKMIEDGEIEKVSSKYFQKDQKKYLPRRNPNLSVFNAQETKTIDEVLDKLSDMNAAKISDYSHQDIPWMVTSEGKTIEYESVFYRTPAYSVRAIENDQISESP